MKTGRLIGRLRLNRPMPSMVVRPDGQATHVAAGHTLVGDGTGVGLPDVDTQQPDVLRHAPALHGRLLLTTTQVDHMKREAKRMRRAQGVAHHVALRCVAQAHGYASWADVVRQANP